MSAFFDRLKNVKGTDLLAGIGFLLAFVPSLVFRGYLKRTGKSIWVICEEKYEARDNGFVLFKYITQHHPEVQIYYAIHPKSPDYQKVSAYGPTIRYGSFRHWVYYLAAEANISSQKGGKPNAAVCYFLEVYGLLKNKRFFLQHGVILNDTDFLHYDLTKMRLFVCGAYPEYQYVKEAFGYPEGYVQYLGLCRFDELHQVKPDPKLIVMIPTWRNWFRMNSKAGDDSAAEKHDFRQSDYYQRFQSMINNSRLCDYLETNDLRLVFYPHRNMQEFVHYFHTDSSRVIVADSAHYDLQELLRNGSLMITDYSSVSMDFAYMKKPVIYYQFDQEKFRKYQYTQGYFSYEENGFGPVLSREDDVVDAVISYCESGFVPEEQYLQRHQEFFPLYDADNCRRNYEAIRDILKMEK